MTILTPTRRTSRGPGRRRGAGFTLIEAAITTVIIGVGCVAMLQLLAAGTMANGESAELTTAMNLAGNVRECLAGVAFSDPEVSASWGLEAGETTVSTYDDLDDFDGRTFSPPIDARRVSLPAAEYGSWSQSVLVESVRSDDLTQTMSHLTLPPADRPTSRVTVTVRRDGKVIHTQSWIAAFADPSH